MAVSGCYLVMKYLLVLLNFLFLVSGWAISGLSIWFILDPTQFAAGAAAGSSRYQLGLYVLLGTGLVLATIAVVGLCGALRGSKCCLSAFFCLLTVFVVAEAAAAWWGAAHTQQLREQVTGYMKNTIAQEYGQKEPITKAIDTFQRELNCCGAEGASDYIVSKYGAMGTGGDGKTLDLSLMSGLKEYRVPASCCVRSVPGDECNAARTQPLTGAMDSRLHISGCVSALSTLAQRHAPVAAAVAVAALSLQVLALLLSVCLCLNSSDTERYKA